MQNVETTKFKVQCFDVFLYQVERTVQKANKIQKTLFQQSFQSTHCRDVNETFSSETFGFLSETRPETLQDFSRPRRDLWFLGSRRDRDVTRPRRFSRPSHKAVLFV